MWLQPSGELHSIITQLSVVPVNITENPLALETPLDIFRSMFFHSGLMHLLTNMLYLYLFGDNVEDRMGEILYLILYFCSGAAAAFSQILINPYSRIPMVGASGAIAGILGSYLLLFPGVRVRGIIPIWIFSGIAEWRAWVVLLMWFGLQLIYGALGLFSGSVEGSGVAFFAHIGGFVFGLVFTAVFMKLVPQPPVKERRKVLYERAKRYRF
jgi:membrane associated rhomboid family serine protease